MKGGWDKTYELIIKRVAILKIYQSFILTGYDIGLRTYIIVSKQPILLKYINSLRNTYHISTISTFNSHSSIMRSSVGGRGVWQMITHDHKGGRGEGSGYTILEQPLIVVGLILSFSLLLILVLNILVGL